jgi:hypothetical protein
MAEIHREGGPQYEERLVQFLGVQHSRATYEGQQEAVSRETDQHRRMRGDGMTVSSTAAENIHWSATVLMAACSHWGSTEAETWNLP